MLLILITLTSSSVIFWSDLYDLITANKESDEDISLVNVTTYLNQCIIQNR